MLHCEDKPPYDCCRSYYGIEDIVNGPAIGAVRLCPDKGHDTSKFNLIRVRFKFKLKWVRIWHIIKSFILTCTGEDTSEDEDTGTENPMYDISFWCDPKGDKEPDLRKGAVKRARYICSDQMNQLKNFHIFDRRERREVKAIYDKCCLIGWSTVRIVLSFMS